VYIVGPAPNTLTWSRSITSSTLAGSNRAPASAGRARTVTFMIALIPNTWNSGSVATTTESGARIEELPAGFCSGAQVCVRE
jgi:hypothetical protein